MNARLIVLARAPQVAGKTRLCTGLRAGAARRLREALLLDTLEVALAAGVPVTMAIAPGAAIDDVRALVARDRTLAAPAGTVDWTAQAGGDLGARMGAALREALDGGAHGAVLIGSDLPSLPPEHVTRALAALEDEGADVVLGPATDGGYYLVGARGPVDALFDGIAWGTPEVFAATRARAEALGLAVRTVPAWFDVDDRDDLRRVIDARGDGAPRCRVWAAGHWGVATRR